MLTPEMTARTLARFEEHRQAWNRNPALRALYGDWYARVATELPARELGPRVEIGSGPGFARHFVPDLTLTDIVKAPWHEHEVSAEQLPFDDGSLAALVLFDVLHHVPAPARFFAEAARTLRSGGRIVMCEPYVSPLSYPVYRWLHPEPLDMNADPLAAAGARDPFDSNQAIPTLLFGRGRARFEREFPMFGLRSLVRLAGPSYPASGGLSRGVLLPMPVWHGLRGLESRMPELAFALIGFRMLVVLERA
jgi:SAM-dependent methyltransferase